MSMEERKKVTRTERATTVGPLDRPTNGIEQPVASSSNKPLPPIKDTLVDDFSQLTLQEKPSIEQATREALTDPLLFETVPAAFSLSFVLGKQPANPDSLSLEDLLNQGQYYLVILRTQHLLTNESSTFSLQELWSLWLLRAESLRLLLAPRLAALELNRIKIPPTARIPWDFQALKILLIGMASGRWYAAINEWYAMATETRIGLSHAKQDQDLWRLRLRKLEDLVIYGLIEVKNYDLATRHLKGLIRRHPEEHRHTVTLFHLSLQMGQLAAAEALLTSFPSDNQSEASAILSLAKEDYPSAIEKYLSLLESPSHHTLSYASNLALTHLYTANVQTAIAVLEPKLRERRNTVGVLPHAAYNLCTMYEIRDDKARSRKEGIMESVVGRYGDICGKAHFKLDSLR